jgi:hypothetical protein
MQKTIQARILDREGMAANFVNAGRANLDELPLTDLVRMKIPDRGAVVGKWRRDADPFPDILIVRDGDLSDTHAWLSSFFSALSPISQWCRIVPQSNVTNLIGRNDRPTLDHRLGGWIGLILAECSAQAGQAVNLKELPGTAALASSTFAAARAVAVWGDSCDLREIASRHDELSTKLREGSRPISAAQLLPLWQTLIGYDDPLEKNVDRRRAFAPFISLFEQIFSQTNFGPDNIAEVVSTATDHFRIPQLIDCSRGPQLDRVRALDQLAQDLARNGKTGSAEALLGFAASLIEPGVGVLPELLKKYSPRYPLAPLWLGSFAGCWSSNRALTDHSGLGRLIAKALLVESDLNQKPQCDISYDEISRWLNGITASKLPLRGMASRLLSIEIHLGVTCAFALGRPEHTRVDTAATLRRDDSGSTYVESQRVRPTPPNTQQIAFLARSLDVITRRVDELERYVSADRELQRKIATEASQQDLLSGLQPTQEASKPAKKK